MKACFITRETNQILFINKSTSFFFLTYHGHSSIKYKWDHQDCFQNFPWLSDLHQTKETHHQNNSGTLNIAQTHDNEQKYTA